MCWLLVTGFAAWVYLDISYIISVHDDVAKMLANPHDTDLLRVAFSIYTGVILGLNVFWWFFISDAIKCMGELNGNKTECNTSNAASGYSAG